MIYICNCESPPLYPKPRTHVSTVGGKPQLKDKQITKPILPNTSNPGQPISLNYPWETARTENN